MDTCLCCNDCMPGGQTYDSSSECKSQSGGVCRGSKIGAEVIVEITFHVSDNSLLSCW